MKLVVVDSRRIIAVPCEISSVKLLLNNVYMPCDMIDSISSDALLHEMSLCETYLTIIMTTRLFLAVTLTSILTKTPIIRLFCLIFVSVAIILALIFTLIVVSISRSILIMNVSVLLTIVWYLSLYVN